MNESHKILNKSIFKLLIIPVVVLACVLVFISPYIIEYFSASSQYGDAITFNVESGATSRDVATKLQEQGLIKSKYTFMIKYRLNRNLYKKIKKETKGHERRYAT